MRRRTRLLIAVPAVVAVVFSAALMACTRQGGFSGSREAAPPPGVLVDWGRSVFRYETFGNERFWTDTLGLVAGLDRVTPDGLLAAGLRFDGDKLPADVRRSEPGAGPYTDPATTRRLIEANAVIGLVARGDRVGVTCALCHSAVDDRIGPGVGRRLDGVPNTALRAGRLIAWGERSRAYALFLNVRGIGPGPRVDPALFASREPDGAALMERQADAALRAWLPGQADTTPDGIDNPTDTPAIFNLQDVGPYTWTGAFPDSIAAHNYFFSVVLDPTTLATTEGRTFLASTAGSAGEDLHGGYRALLSALDPGATWPHVVAKPGGFALFRATHDIGFQVARDDLDAVSAYLARMLPPPSGGLDQEAVDAGRRVFRASGCNECHLEGRKTIGRIIPLGKLVSPGDHRSTGYDDALIAVAMRDERAGYKVPQLLGLELTAPYLHDGSVGTLDALFSPERGPAAPHPFYVRHPDERAELAAYLLAWDGRAYP
ncbi:MAG: hypothetical protein ABIO65_09815 [Nitrospiria bacterium]